MSGLVKTMSKEECVQFVDARFKTTETITMLYYLMKEVTKKEINAANINAACNCVARMNETINTAVTAAKFLGEK